MGRPKYTTEQREFAKTLLQEAALPRDALPYTTEFDRLFKTYEKANFPRLDRHGFWQLLCRAGKQGGARQKRATRAKLGRVPALTQDEVFELLRLCPDGIGGRDSLPYTTEFDDMWQRFNDHTGRNLAKNEFWRVLSRLAKRSRRPKPIEYVAPSSILPPALERHLFKMNPWWKGEACKPTPRYRRIVYESLCTKLVRGISPIIAVRGPRQIGKTTLQLQMIEDLLRKRLAAPQQVLRIQFDELEVLGSLVEPIGSITDWYERNILRSSINDSCRNGKPVFLFLDEIQNLKAWDAQLKALADHVECRVYLTGSSALRIQHGRDSLAGRIESCELGPLSLAEIAGFRDYGPLKPYATTYDMAKWLEPDFWNGLGSYESSVPLLVHRSFRDFSECGGYPQCHGRAQMDKSAIDHYLKEVVVQRTIDHDLRVGGGRRDGRLLREVFKLALRYAGQAPKLSKLSQELSDTLESNVKPGAVGEYMDFLQNSLLLKLIEPLELRNKRQPYPRKICPCDHRVREAWLQECVPLTDDDTHACDVNSDLAGHLVEGVLGYFLSGFEGISLFHFPERPNEPEVDFVMVIGDVHIPIEVKYRPKAMRAEYLQGLKSFIGKQTYNAPFGLLVSKNDRGRHGDIIAVPAVQMLLLR